MSTSSTGKRVIRILTGSGFAPTFSDPEISKQYVEGYIERAQRVIEGLPLGDGGASHYSEWTISHTIENLGKVRSLVESTAMPGKER